MTPKLMNSLSGGERPEPVLEIEDFVCRPRQQGSLVGSPRRVSFRTKTYDRDGDTRSVHREVSETEE